MKRYAKGKRILGRCRRGYTFIEMLLVVSLISATGLAVYQSLANGLKIWERSKRYSVDEDVAIFLDKITRDLRNAFAYSLISFEGEETRVAFSTIVTTRADKGKTRGAIDYVDQIGQVEYSFDKMHSSLLQRQANYSHALKEKYGQQRLLAAPVRSLEFFYYYGNGDNTEIKRKAEGALPSAIRMEIEITEDTGNIRKIQKFVNLPLGT